MHDVKSHGNPTRHTINCKSNRTVRLLPEHQAPHCRSYFSRTRSRDAEVLGAPPSRSLQGFHLPTNRLKLFDLLSRSTSTPVDRQECSDSTHVEPQENGPAIFPDGGWTPFSVHAGRLKTSESRKVLDPSPPRHSIGQVIPHFLSTQETTIRSGSNPRIPLTKTFLHVSWRVSGSDLRLLVVHQANRGRRSSDYRPDSIV